MYRWTVALRDALISAELREQLYAYNSDNDPDDATTKYLIRSMSTLASIPIGGELKPTGDEVEVDGDVEPAPTWEWVAQLVAFYYGNELTPTVVELMRD